MTQTEPKPPFPLFYSSAEPLSRTRHADLGLVRHAHPYAFAARTNAVPINISEFNLAQKCYPIVFTPNPPHHALAILGMDKDENLFVDERGAWSTDHYIPAYVRRYPFIIAPSPEDANQFVLCVEMTSELVSTQPDMPFFKDGEMTETGHQAMIFCKEFHEHSVATRPFIEALEEFGLLKEHDLTFQSADGTDRKLGSYCGIDEDKLKNCDDQTFLELRRRDFLPLIYMHLASLLNWSRLVNLRSRKLAQSGNGDTRH